MQTNKQTKNTACHVREKNIEESPVVETNLKLFINLINQDYVEHLPY